MVMPYVVKKKKLRRLIPPVFHFEFPTPVAKTLKDRHPGVVDFIDHSPRSENVYFKSRDMFSSNQIVPRPACISVLLCHDVSHLKSLILIIFQILVLFKD